MYVKGQYVYVFFNDLKASLIARKIVEPSRFAHVIEIEKITYGKEVFNSYKVKTTEGTTFKISKDSSFGICSVQELEEAVLSIKDKVSDSEYNLMMTRIKSMLQ